MRNLDLVVYNLTSRLLPDCMLTLLALGMPITLSMMRLVKLADGESLVSGRFPGCPMLLLGLYPIAALLQVRRNSNSACLRANLCEALRQRGVVPHLFETAVAR